MHGIVEQLLGQAFQAPEQAHQGPLRLVLAVLLGVLAGFERERKGHFAGLRTHAMVALGAAGFTLIACQLFEHVLTRSPESAGHALRIISAIVGGVGFLGAGAILHTKSDVKGLTTAAGLWAIAAAGVACGLALPGVAITIGLLCVVLLVASGLDEAAQSLGKAGREDGQETGPRADGRSG
ncbi:MAG: membrane protein [Phycisphaerales bacterium]|nr:MAG: membrane protein [Phycisphaerales bacterium]